MRHCYLVTTFNHAAYIEDMLGSLRAQYLTLEEFLSQARVLVVDDASTDHTAQVLRTMENKFSNVSVHLNLTNRGIGRNRNFLLDWFNSQAGATDSFVAFVDGDDLLTKDHLKTKLALFAAEPELECVGGQLELFYDDDRPRHVVDTFSPDPEIQAIANLFECHFYISNALFRGRVFARPDVRFPETPTSEDWLFFATHPLRKRHCREVTLHYRRHVHNLTTRAFEDGLVFGLRKTARALSLLKMGVHPSDRETQLLDLVGYLSFRTRWNASLPVNALHCHMPWFAYLHQQPRLVQTWPYVRRELRALFDKLIESNSRIPAYSPQKLAAFLTQLLELADAEVAQSSAPSPSSSEKVPTP